MSKNIRNKILKILVNPTTITELKNKIKEVKSFGTLVYHLKQLQQEGIITKKSKEKKGEPITYQVYSKETLQLFDKIKKEEFKHELAYLDFVSKNPNTQEEIIMDKLSNEGYDQNYLDDTFSNLHSKQLVFLNVKITPKGKKFLEEHKDKS